MAQSILTTQQEQILKQAMEAALLQQQLGTTFLGSVDLGKQLTSLRDGIVPSVRLNLATNPTANDTVVIGGHTFKWVAALGAAVAQTQVKIGASAAASLAVLVNAINGVADAVNILEGTTSFVAAATAAGWAVVADNSAGTVVRVREVLASYHGLANYAVAKAPTSIAVSETLTDASDVWSHANLNLTGQGPGKKFVKHAVTVTAAMLTFGSLTIDLPFTPSAASLEWEVRTAGGLNLDGPTDTVTVSGNTIVIDMDAGGSPDFEAGMIVTFFISE